MKLPLNACLILCYSLLSVPVFAAEVHGVKLPDSIALAGKALTLNGAGVRTKSIFNIKVYVAGLYLETASKDAYRIVDTDGVRRIVLRMTHNAPRQRMKDEFLDGLERNSRVELPALRERLDRLFRAIPDLKEGHELAITYVPGKGTSIKCTNGGEVSVPGKDVADALLRVWLGKDPLDADLRRRLLGA